MAIKIESIKPGDVLLDVHSTRMGNTTMRRLGVWSVEVVSIDVTNRCARVRWNGNREETWYGARLRRLRRFAPEWLSSGLWSDGDRFYCHHCHARGAKKDSANHRPNCPHPKAVAWRKKHDTEAQ